MYFNSNVSYSHAAGVVTILKSIENAQLSSEQLQSIVESLLAMAAEGGWSEARKGADAGFSKKLEEANAIIAGHKVPFI